MIGDGFYGPDQAHIHHTAFGDLAEQAAHRLLAELRSAGHAEGLVVDLGCGSGILARAVSDAGYAVDGVDLAPAMLDLARRNAPRATFRQGSLLDVALPPAVAVTAIGEALNYLTDDRAGPDALGEVFKRVRASLAPGGVFLFDVATPGRHGPERTANRLHDRDTWTLFMHAVERDDGRRLDRYVTIFRRRGDGAYDRTDEHHALALYDPATLVALLEAEGFTAEVRDSYGAPTPSTPAGGWVVVLARAA
ncbi:MAG TPA: class I SAM-dependent methyltransferase [Acidimicrobiia bacterium]|nr:class I SAM-dependent methyltransferase [Acidimicrobiia bacterium]